MVKQQASEQPAIAASESTLTYYCNPRLVKTVPDHKHDVVVIDYHTGSFEGFRFGRFP